MFKDPKKARKQMFIIMNEILRDLQMETAFIDWKDNLPNRIYFVGRYPIGLKSNVLIKLITAQFIMITHLSP